MEYAATCEALACDTAATVATGKHECVLQSAACCSVLQGVAECCSGVQCVAEYWSVLQCVRY